MNERQDPTKRDPAVFQFGRAIIDRLRMNRIMENNISYLVDIRKSIGLFFMYKKFDILLSKDVEYCY